MGQAGQSTSVAAPERRIIERPRLLNQLEETDARTILLIAPAGYGKTTLARQWMSRHKAAWLSVDSRFVDIETFTRGVAASLSVYSQKRCICGEQDSRARKRAVPDLLALATQLVAAHDCTENMTLIIDDYQSLGTSPLVDQFVETLSKSDHLRLLISSRVLPRWATSRRHIYGETFELQRDDLAFDDREANELLADSARSEDIARLARGWPAVLGLALNAGTPGAPLRETISETLDDFLTNESYDIASPQTQRALLEIALLPSVNRATVSEALGTQTEKIVEEAARTGLLTVSRHSIDLHPLAKGFLLRKLHSSPEAESRVRDAVTHALASGAWDDAFDLVEEFRLYDQLEDLINSSFAALLAVGDIEKLVRFGHRASLTLEKTTAAMTLIDAEVAFRDGLLTRARDLAISAATDLSPSHPLKSRGYALAATAALVAFDVEKSLGLNSRGLDFGREPHDECSALWGRSLALIYLEDNRCHGVIQELGRLGSIMPEANLRAATARLMARRLGEGFLGFDSTLSNGELLADADNPRARTAFGNVCAYALALRGRYSEALIVIDSAIADAELHSLAFAKPHLYWTRAMVELGLRQFSKADTHLRVVESAASLTDDCHLELNARTLRARILLAQTRPQDAFCVTALEWDSIPTKAMYGEYLATRALALAVLGEHTEARRILHRARDLTGVVEVQVLTATASAIAALDTPKARTTAGLALTAAVRLDTWDALVCGVRASPRLLETLASNSSNHRYLLTMLRESRDHSLSKFSGLPIEHNHRLPGLLSPRETEVADLLCQGLTNKEIARTLYISDATAKVHVRHILNKLGARTRTEAVALYIPTEEKGIVGSDSVLSSAS